MELLALYALEAFLTVAQNDRSLQCEQAAQLMPPPRLPRHLRPCHPPGTAIQVRCAHKTARTAFSTDGDEPPQFTTGKSSDASTNGPNRSTDSSTDASVEMKSWWSVTVDKIASLAFKPASTERNLLVSDTPSAPTRMSTKDDQDPQVGNVSETSQGLFRKMVVSDEKSQQLLQRREPGSKKKKKVEADGRNLSNSTYRRVRSVSSTLSNTPISSRNLHGQQRRVAEQARKREEKLVANKPGSAPVSLREEVNSIQQKLQQLSGDIRALQVALEAKPTVESLSTPAAGRNIRSTNLRMSSDKQRRPELASSLPTAVHVAASTNDLPAPEPPKPSPRVQNHHLHQIYQTAWSMQKSWMTILGTAAEYLADMPPRVVAPVASSVLRSIHAIQLEPTLNEATGQIAHLSPANRRAARSLAIKLVPRNRSDALLAGRATYRDSISQLTDVANSLGEIQSPLVASIVTHVRNRLRVMAEDAVLENDFRTHNVMENYRNLTSLYAEARHSPKLTRQPGLILRLERVIATRQLEEYHRSMDFIKRDLSRIFSASKTRQSKHSDVGNVRTKFKKVVFDRSVPDTGKSVITKVFKAVPERVVLRTTKPDIRSRELPDDWVKKAESTDAGAAQKKGDGSGLVGQIHKRSRSMQPDDLKTKPGNTGDSPNPVSKSTKSDSESSERSLLEELFPEANSTPQPQHKGGRDHPKIEPPMAGIIRPQFVGRPPTLKEKVVESFRKQGEQVTVLQLTNCSTQLTEVDFRRVIPKGKHIEGWRRDGDFYKVIPGRDPLSLERLPFYYLLFSNAEAALAYQKNVSRLHKLCALHQPANIFSAIPPPTGFLEEGEDISAAISSYNLLPTHHPISLNFLMQPYNPALRALIERGGYQPIAPSVDEHGKPIWRVLMRIEGYEPRPSDLFKVFSHDAYTHGMTLPLRNESQSSIHRVRDMINLRMSSKLISSSRPRAYGTFDHSASPLAKTTEETTFDDPAIQKMMAGADEDGSPQQMTQLVMNRVYNRWVIDFEDEDSARRWSAIWHRKVLPDLSDRKGAWKDAEEERICNTEVLW